MTPPRRPSFALGAVELVELGRSGALFPSPAAPARRPFFAVGGRRVGAPRLGDVLTTVGKFLTDALSTIFSVIADIVQVPTEILASGVDVIFENVAAVLAEIPLLGELVAQAVLAAGAVLKFAIQVPHMALEQIANLFEGFSEALEATMSGDEKSEAVSQARKKIVSEAPEALRPQVNRMLTSDRNDVRRAVNEGGDPVPTGSALEDALKIGVPAALAVGAVALIAAG